MLGHDKLVGRPFLHDRLVVVAGPDLMRAAGEIKPAVVRGIDAERSWSVDIPKGSDEIEVDPVLRLSSLVMIRDAVRTGAGGGAVPLSLVSRDIGTGRMA